MKVYSDDFEDGKTIPREFGYRTENISPHIGWEDIPIETKSLALLCNDPDAPAGDWIHWIVHSIDPSIKEIPKGGPIPGVELQNGFGRIGWGGPAPPSGTHRYFFTLYALDVPRLEGVSKKEFKDRCERHKIGKAQFMGTYP
ncbi:MAG: YbhB/YbcL family Raf kinase inhibitor-like protein [Candidatus Thorarchaeota archaeon]